MKDSNAEREFSEISKFIRDVCERLEVNRPTTENAIALYKKARDKNLHNVCWFPFLSFLSSHFLYCITLQRKSKRHVAAVCIHIASRKGSTRSLKEISKATNFRKRDVSFPMNPLIYPLALYLVLFFPEFNWVCHSLLLFCRWMLYSLN